MRIAYLSSAALAAVLATSSAQAAVVAFGAPLAPEGVVTTGIGYSFVKFDTVTRSMTVNVSFSRLVGTTTVTHIHCCQAVAGTGNVGVATTTPTFVGFPVGVRSGVFSATYDMNLIGSWNPTFVNNNGGIPSAFNLLVARMGEGKTYLNVHTTFAPGGEIRSELAPVPEPQTWAMMIGGFALTGIGMRVRARKAAHA